MNAEVAAHLFTLLTLRGVTFRNGFAVSPMCQYSSDDGFANDWHFVHLGSRAAGGAGLVITEASAVSADGRISAADLGIWKDDHISSLKRVTRFIERQGAVAGIQIAHAGRKASTQVPWLGTRAVTAADGGWQPVGPSRVLFRSEDPTPRALGTDEIQEVVD